MHGCIGCCGSRWPAGSVAPGIKSTGTAPPKPERAASSAAMPAARLRCCGAPTFFSGSTSADGDPSAAGSAAALPATTNRATDACSARSAPPPTCPVSHSLSSVSGNSSASSPCPTRSPDTSARCLSCGAGACVPAASSSAAALAADGAAGGAPGKTTSPTVSTPSWSTTPRTAMTAPVTRRRPRLETSLSTPPSCSRPDSSSRQYESVPSSPPT
mmetsp:Transcript_37117/g.116686  ORF Transcript_37117/g.116686 Transcript_37117/m.116686 type:complete len:215 (+) Transcript_37117:675-1319(+)